MNPDVINGLIEFTGALFAWLSVRKVLKDKAVAGISWVHVAFFTAWGYWNVFFYPWYGLTWSFVGGVCLALVNSLYVVLLLRYGSRGRDVSSLGRDVARARRREPSGSTGIVLSVRSPIRDR